MRVVKTEVRVCVAMALNQSGAAFEVLVIKAVGCTEEIEQDQLIRDRPGVHFSGIAAAERLLNEPLHEVVRSIVSVFVGIAFCLCSPDDLAPSLDLGQVHVRYLPSPVPRRQAQDGHDESLQWSGYEGAEDQSCKPKAHGPFIDSVKVLLAATDR